MKEIVYPITFLFALSLLSSGCKKDEVCKNQIEFVNNDSVYYYAVPIQFVPKPGNSPATGYNYDEYNLPIIEIGPKATVVDNNQEGENYTITYTITFFGNTKETKNYRPNCGKQTFTLDY